MMKSNNKDTCLYNFGAGPGCLPLEVLNQIRKDIPDWYQGMSVMEVSHRLPVFVDLTEQIELKLRQLLAIPDEFVVLFMQGGARSQFSLVPLNLLAGSNTADYLITGHWSKLAYQDASHFCKPHCVADNESLQFTAVSPQSQWQHSKEGAYFHYTDNETIQGIELSEPPVVPNKQLICDMTSSILTKTIDFNRFGLIYASAQKNLGIAGLTLVVVRKSLLGKAHPLTPLPFKYDVCYQNHSMCNTPPVFCWYVTGLIIDWALTKGLPQLISDTALKAKLIYEVIDSGTFYQNNVESLYRSRITIPFQLPTPALTEQFLQEADVAGLKQLKGHKIVGGIRACLYNAMPIEGAKALAKFMKVFQEAHS